MRNFIQNPKNWMPLCVVLAVLFALIYSFLSSTNANLPSYMEPPPSRRQPLTLRLCSSLPRVLILHVSSYQMDLCDTAGG